MNLSDVEVVEQPGGATKARDIAAPGSPAALVTRTPSGPYVLVRWRKGQTHRLLRMRWGDAMRLAEELEAAAIVCRGYSVEGGAT